MRHFILTDEDGLLEADALKTDARDNENVPSRTYSQRTEEAKEPKTVIMVTAMDSKGNVRVIAAPEGTEWHGGWTASGGERTPTLVVVSAEAATALGVDIGTTMGAGKCDDTNFQWSGVAEVLPQTLQQTVQEGGKKAEPQGPMEETWQMQGGRGRVRKGTGTAGKGTGKGGRGMWTCYPFQRGACERENCLFEHVLVEPVAADKQWAELTRERLWMRRAVEKTARRHAAWPKKPTPARAAEEKVLAARQKERVRVLACTMRLSRETEGSWTN